MRAVLFLLPIAACVGAADKTAVDSGEPASGDDTAAPVVPRIAWFDDVYAVDLSADGRVALVQRASSIEAEVLLIDTETDEMESATTLGDALKDFATGVANDGVIAALHGVPTEAGLWREADGWTDLPSPFSGGCDVDNGSAFDLSDDGSVVIGMMWDGCVPVAFRWTEAGGVQLLDVLGEGYDGGPPTNRATVVSGDGQVAAGFAQYGGIDRAPARWTADGHGALLAPEDRDAPGEVLAIDYDGGTLGVIRGNDGYLWSASGWTALGRLDTALPTDPVYTNALSKDGRVAFGAVGNEFFSLPTAFTWDATNGMRSLQEVAIAAGVPIEEGYWLTNVMAVSDDGTVVLGRGYDPSSATVAFVMHIPATAWGQ